ncbi:hypothetical protein JCM10212_003514 [Sporobolomyces blumeae]
MAGLSSNPNLRTFPSNAFSISVPASHSTSSSSTTLDGDVVESPRRKRHASLDVGVGHFRSRTGSISLSTRTESTYASPTTISFGDEIRGFRSSPKKMLASPFDCSKPSNSNWYSRHSRLAKTILGFVGVFVLGAMALHRTLDGGEWWTARTALADLVGIEFAQNPDACENPYAELGRIQVDLKTPENNRWRPYDPACRPPALMATLRKVIKFSKADPEPLTFPLPPRKPTNPSMPLSWLQGKTVLLFGDHVERNHNKDFCRFAGGKFATIGRDHPLSPPRFVNGIDEKLPGANQENYDGSRPAVCYIAEYDFTVVSVFHFGLANRVEFEHESLLYDPHFYPPVAVEDRLTHIVLPILDSLNRTRPDLIEFSSGFWDLRHFTALDELAGIDPWTELTADRLSWYSERLTRAFADLADVFPQTPLLWRSMHQTPEYANTPPARVAALDALSRKVVAYLNESRTVGDAKARLDLLLWSDSSDSFEDKRGIRNGDERPRRKTFKNRGNSRARFLNKVKERIGSTERVRDFAFGNYESSLKGMITIDEWGTLMRGQEHSMNKVHTPPLPGGYLWGDVMLYFLQRLSAPPHFRFRFRL